MAERRRMVVEVHADLGPFTQQVRAGLAAVGGATIPVASPVGATVGAGIGGSGAGGAVGSGGTGAAVAQAMAQAQAAASPYALQAAFGGMSNAQRVNQSWDDAAFEQFLGRAPGTQPAGTTGGRRGGGFFGAPHPGAIRALTFQGVHELANATTSIRNAEALAGFASRRSEASLMRAEGIEQAAGGYFGTVAFGAFDLFGADWTPAGVARNARQGVAVERAQADQMTRRYAVQANTAYRDAYGTGGTSAAEAARAESISSRRIGELQGRASDLSARLSEQMTRTVTGQDEYGEIVTSRISDYVMTGAARGTAQGELGTVNQELRDARDQARFEAARRADDVSDARRNVGNATRRAQLVARGGSARDLARYDLGADASDRMTGAFRNRGYAGMAEEWARFGADSAAQEFGFGRQDRADLSALRSASIADGYRAGGQNLQASLVDIQAGTDAAIAAETGPGGANRPEVIAAIRNAGAASRQSAVGNRNRQIGASLQQIGTSNAIMQAQLSNNPLGATLAGIQGNRDADIAAVKDGGFGGWIQRQAISTNAGLQEQLARRDFDRMRSDLNRGLSGAQERASLGLRGGPLAGVRSSISSIIEQTDMDVRGMEDRGLDAEAASRRRLGLTQLRGTETDFYRSIPYGSANPRGVVGSGNLDGVRGAFRDAREAIPDTGRGEGSSGGAGITSQQAAQMLEYLRQMAMQGIAAMAG
jgi:hypothetical protein